MEMKKCSSCELYNISNCEDLINNLLKIPGEKHITNINCKAFTCHMCCQNRTLLEHIKEQNELIAGLRYRINSLTVIRNMECDIDDISKQFSEISVSSQSDISFINAPPIAATETHSIVDTTATLVNTTVWDSTYSEANSLMLHESIHQQFKMTQTEAKQQQTSDVQTAHQEVQTIPASKITQVEDKEVQTLPSDQESIQPDTEISDEFSATPFSKIDTLLIGDKSVQHVKLNSSKKTLKIARSNTSAQQLIETADYYLNKFPNIKHVVFQAVHSDMIDKGSEELKVQYRKLISSVKASHAKLLISGPIPDPLMISESFSRASSVNDWLIKQVEDGFMSVIDNFKLFWNKPYFFQTRSSILGKQGINKLQSAMNSSLSR